MILAFRLCWRLSVIFLWTLISYPCLLAASLLPGKPLTKYLRRRGVVKTWCKGMARIMGIKIIVKGPVPASPFMLVSNHLGYIDILVMCTVVPAYYVAKSDVKKWPGVGTILHASNIIYINRNQKRDLTRAKSEMLDKFDQGASIAFFPEGTSTGGKEILPFKPSLLEVPASNQIPVHYLTLLYTSPEPNPTQFSVCWWGDMPFTSHFFRILKLKNITAKLTFGEQAITHPDRKILASQLRDKMTAQFTPITLSDP